MGTQAGLHLRRKWRRQQSARHNLSPDTDSGSDGEAYKLLNTQFGFLITNLVLSDLCQAIGFSLNLLWIARGTSPSPERAHLSCNVQGAFSGLGDVASALWSITLAIHTLCLIMRWTITRRWLIAIFLFNWSLVAVLGLLGPLVVQTTAAGPFYSWTGVWVFIVSSLSLALAKSNPVSAILLSTPLFLQSLRYNTSRLYLHYMLIFIACIVTAVVYLVIFLAISNHTRKASKILGQQPQPEMIATARKMLLYPVSPCMLNFVRST